ncbi:discoidin domain-containing protein [Mesotoga prima]|uniref:discoidin domain-containing protein n=1 Tax=Mesotoga prima TaxID=1184387 RepID=UPI002FDB7490
MITKEGSAYFNNIVARGTIYATDGIFNGTVYADDGVFTGTVYANDGIFNGTVYATDGEFSGTIYATDGEFTGTIHAVGGEFSGSLYTEIGEIAGWIINHDSILGYYGETPSRSIIELNKTLQYIGAYQESDLPGGIFIKIDESGLPYASFGNRMVYSNGNLTFAEGVITWDNLDSESQANISGYTAEISPNTASVYNNGSSITPSTQTFIAKLIQNIDNAEVSGCTFVWSAVVPAGTYISSGQFGSTAIIDTSSQNGPAIYKCVITKDAFTFEVSVSISYSSKGETGDIGDDAVNYWLTVSKDYIAYNPNDKTYDGAEESYVVFTAKKSVGSLVSNATGLHWELNGISTTPDANGYQKTIKVDNQSAQVNTIDIYDVSGGQLLDTATVDVIVAGEDSYSIVLSNEHQTIASDHDGNNLDPSSIVTTVSLFKGTNEVTDFTLSAIGAVVDNIAKTVTVSPPDGATMSGQQVIAVLVGGVQIGTKTFTWSKSPQGDPGLDAEIYWLISDKEAVMHDPNDDTYDGAASATVVFTAIKSVGNVISNPTNLYWSLNGSPADPDVNGYQKTITVNSNEVNTLSIYADSAREELLDIITIPVLVAGSDTYSIVLSNEHQTVKCFDDGTSPDPSLISTIVLLYKGVQLQDESSYWIEASAGEANQSFKSVSYTVPSSSTMSGDIIITVRASQAGSIIGTKKFTWSKSPQGEPGEDGQDAEIYWLFANKDKVVYNPNNNTYDGGASSTIVFTAGKSTGNVVTNPTDLYWTLDGVSTSPDANLYQKTVSISTSDTVSVSIYKDSGLSQLLDTVTVPVLSEGSNAYSIVLTNEHQTVYAKNDGTSPDPSSAGTGVQLYFGTELLTSYWIEASSGTVDQEFKTVNVDIPNNSTVSGSSTITVKTSEFGELIGTKKFTWSKSNQGDQGIPGEDAKSIRLSATSQIFKADQDNNITSGNITLNANLQNITGTVTWSTTPSISLVEGSNGNEKVVTSGNFGANTAVQVTASIDGYSDKITLVRVQEGTDAIVCFLTNETHAVPTNSDGSNPDFSGATSTMKVFRGSSEDTGWSFAWSLLSGTSEATGTNTHTITITGLSADTAMWRCTGSKNGFSDVIKDFTVSKGKQGVQGIQGEQGIPGEDAEGIYLTSTSQLFVADQDNNITSDNIVFTANVQNVEGTISWTTDPEVILSDGVYSYQKVLTPANFGSNNSVKVMATIGGYSDYITVVRVRDGSSSITGMLSNESHAITCDDDGNNPDLTGASSTAYVFRGSVDDSINWSYSWQCISGTSEASGTNTRTISISSLDTDVAVWRLTAIRSGFSDITKDFTITKSKHGSAGADATIYWIESSADYVKYNPNVGTYDPSSITLYAKKRVGNGTPVSTNVYWKIDDGAWSASATSSYTINNPTTFTAVIAESSGAAESAWLDRYTVNTLVEGSDSYSIILTNEHQTVACDVDGYSPDPSSVSIGVIVFRGTTDITSSCTLYTGATVKSNPFTYTIPNSAAMSGSLDVTVKEGSTTIGNKMFTWSKSEKGDQGNPGANAKIVKLSSTSQVFKEDPDGNVTPSSITFTANLQNIAGNAVFTSNPAGLLTGTGNTRTLTSSNFGSNNSVVVTATADSLSDSITVMRLKEGSDAYSIVLTNENQTVASDPSGYFPTPNTISTQVQLYRGITSVTGFTVEATGASVSENNVTVTIPSNTDLSGEQVILVKVGGVSVGSKKLTWSKSRKGVQGIKGDSNIIGTLDNDSYVVATDSAGNNGVYTGCTTTMYVFDGTTDDTSNWTFTINASSGVTAAQSGAHNNTVSVSNMTVDTGFVDITAARSGYTSITKRFVISKSKQGPTGIQGPTGQEATSYWMTGAPAAIKKLSDGSFEPNTFTLYGKKATGTSPVTSYTGLLEIKYTNDGSAWNNFSSSQTAYSTSLTFPKNGVSIPSTAVALRARLYYGSSTSDPLIDEEVIPIVSDGNDALSIVLSASTASATFKVNDTWSTTPAPLNIIATAYKGGSAFTGLPATNFSMTGPLETKTVTSVNGSSTFLISTEELTALKNSVNGLANTFVFNIAFTYSGSTYNAAFALNVKNEKFAWLNEWEGYTTIDSKSVATPMIFAGTLNDTTLTGVFIDSNGLVGLNGASNASNPFAQSESYQTFKLLNDGTAKIASFNFDNDFIYGDNIYLSGGSYPMLGINTDYYGTKGIFAGKYSKPSGDIITEPTSVPMNFTSYINGDYEVSSSGNTSTYYSWKALDDSSLTSYRPSSENPWIQIYNKNGIDISAFKIYYYNADGYKPKHLTVYGSNNGTNFTALYDNNIPEIGYSNALQILEGDYCYKYVRFAFGSSSVTGDPTPDLLRLYQLFIYKRATYPDYGFSLVGDTEYLKWDGSKLTIKAANFELNSDGDITASNVDLSGKITATTGAIGGWSISGNTLNSADNVVVLDSANKVIKVGSHVKLGKDVVTTNYLGLRITADNYWETNGTYTKLSLGGGKLSYDDTSGSAILSIEGKVKATSGYIGGSSSGWVIDSDVLYSGISNTEYSILIDADKSKISIYRDSGMSHPAISLGMDVTATGSHGLAFFNNISGASNNYWIWDTNAVKFRTGDATNYIDFNVSTTNKLSIVTDTFSLATTNMNIDSATEKIAMGGIVLQGATYPYIGVGVTTYGANSGIWMGNSSGTYKLSIKNTAGSKYLLWDGTNLSIEAGNFTLDTSGNLTATNVDLTGKVTASSGAVGGWDINPNNISSNSLTITSGANPYIGLGTTVYGDTTNPGIWMGKDTTWKFSLVNNAANYLLWDGSSISIRSMFFQLDSSGKITAIEADLTGAIKATSGYIGGSSSGWEIGSGLIKNGTDIVLNATAKQITISNGAIKLGIDVESTNDGLYINPTNYWYSTGSFKIGSAASYITGSSSGIAINSTNFTVNNAGTIMAKSGTIGSWKLGTSQLYAGTSTNVYSIMLDAGNTLISLYKSSTSTYPAVKLGMSVLSGKHGLAFYNNTNGTSNNYWVWDTNEVKFRVGTTTSYLDFNVGTADKLKIVTDTFSLSTTNLTIDSATEKIAFGNIVLQGGTSPYIGIGTTAYSSAGIWLGKNDSKWKASFYANANNYLLWDSDILTIKAANFELNSSGNIIATNVDLSGNITAITGEIGGWTINPTSISSSKLSIVSGSSPYIGIEATNFMQKGFWLGETSNNMSIIPVLFDNTYGNIEVSASLNSDNVWLAFNGNQDIVWNSGAHSDAAINIDVDFGTDTKINLVQIYFSNINLTSKSFVIQSSSDGSSWTTVSNDCLGASGHSGWYSVPLFRVINARYYRVLFAASQYTGASLELGQINFSLTAVYPSDVDKFKTNVVESFPESVMDLNLGASWYGEHESSTKFLSIELEEPVEITSYRFYCNSSRYAYNPKSWTLRGSNDEINWKVVHTVIDHADFSSSTWYSYTCDTPGAYKYYEFVFTAYRNSTYVALTEIELLTSATYGFSMSNGANSYISWNNKLNIKGDLYIGTGKSSIYFEDSGIVLGDNKVAWLGSYTSRCVTFSTKYKDSRSLLMAIGYDYDGASSSTLTRFEVQNRFIDYNTPNAFRVFVNDSENSYFGSINLDFISYSSNRDNRAINRLSFLRDSDTTSVGYFKFDTSLKSVIPEWYGTKTTATTKNPNASSWTDAEDCPLSNIWVWRKTSGTPSKVLYVRLPDGNIWWVSMTEL